MYFLTDTRMGIFALRKMTILVLQITSAVPTEQVTATARGISDFGMMAMTAAFFLILSATMMVSSFKWFKSIINGIIQSHNETMAELLVETRKQNERLDDVAEGLRPETMTRIEVVSGVFFDYATERVCRIIKKVRKENHVIDRENTAAKIRTLLTVEHEDRNSKFDSFTFRGRKLSEYTNPEWIEWAAAVVEGEIYNETGENNGRAYTNVRAVYDKIKLDFYHRLKK